MNKRNDINEDELAMFYQAINDEQGATRRIRQDKIHPTRTASKGKTQQKETRRKERQASFYFSDDFEPELPSEGPMSFVREGKDTYLVKQLRRGDYHPELILDLHGFNKENAKIELAAMIDKCRKDHLHCCCIVHGIGNHILKKKIPHYLVQHPYVDAFHQAPLEYGGKGAILALIEVEEDMYRR